GAARSHVLRRPRVDRRLDQGGRHLVAEIEHAIERERRHVALERDRMPIAERMLVPEGAPGRAEREAAERVPLHERMIEPRAYLVAIRMAEQQREEAAGDRAGIAAGALGVLADGAQAVRDRLRPAEPGAPRVDEPAVGPAADRLQHLRAATGQPERRRRAVEGWQLDDRVAQGPELAVVRDRLLRLAERPHQACGLDQLRVALAMVVAVGTDVLPLAGRE